MRLAVDPVILHRAGEVREEIDLPQPPAEVPGRPLAESASDELPQPICPDGSPQAVWPLPESDLAPGESGLDDWSEKSGAAATDEQGTAQQTSADPLEWMPPV